MLDYIVLPDKQRAVWWISHTTECVRTTYMDIFTEFRKIQQTLQRLTIIAEQAKEGILLVDTGGTARFVNIAMAEMHGYPSSKDLIGKKISMFHSEDQVKTDMVPMIEEVKRCGRFLGPIGHLRNDGTLFTTHTKMILLKDRRNRAVGLIEFVTEITKTSELTAANEDLQQQVSERQQEIDRLRQQLDDKEAELSRANGLLEQQIIERKRSEEKLKEYHGQVENLNTELVAAEERFEQQITELRELKEMMGEDKEDSRKLRDQKLPGRVLNEEKLRSLAEMAKRLSR